MVGTKAAAHRNRLVWYFPVWVTFPMELVAGGGEGLGLGQSARGWASRWLLLFSLENCMGWITCSVSGREIGWQEWGASDVERKRDHLLYAEWMVWAVRSSHLVRSFLQGGFLLLQGVDTTSSMVISLCCSKTNPKKKFYVTWQRMKSDIYCHVWFECAFTEGCSAFFCHVTLSFLCLKWWCTGAVKMI